MNMGRQRDLSQPLTCNYFIILKSSPCERQRKHTHTDEKLDCIFFTAFLDSTNVQKTSVQHTFRNLEIHY